MHVTISSRAAALLVVAVTLALGGSLAYASIPDSGGVIHGCYYNGTYKSLRVLDPATQSCSSYETPISWSQTGPQGSQGPPGPQGPKGDPATIKQVSTVVVSKDFPIGTYDIQDGTVTCPTGSVVTGGSYWFGDGDVPIHQPSGNGWYVEASSGLFDPGHFTVYAVCLKIS